MFDRKDLTGNAAKVIILITIIIIIAIAVVGWLVERFS